MQLIPIFLIGSFGTFILLELKRRKLNWAFYLLPSVLFCGITLSALNEDWRINASNIASVAVLIFLPVLAVLYMPKIPNQYLNSKYAILTFGGLTTLFFQYAGFAVAFILGVRSIC